MLPLLVTPYKHLPSSRPLSNRQMKSIDKALHEMGNVLSLNVRRSEFPMTTWKAILRLKLAVSVRRWLLARTGVSMLQVGAACCIAASCCSRDPLSRSVALVQEWIRGLTQPSHLPAPTLTCSGWATSPEASDPASSFRLHLAAARLPFPFFHLHPRRRSSPLAAIASNYQQRDDTRISSSSRERLSDARG